MASESPDLSPTIGLTLCHRLWLPWPFRQGVVMAFHCGTTQIFKEGACRHRRARACGKSANSPPCRCLAFSFRKDKMPFRKLNSRWIGPWLPPHILSKPRIDCGLSSERAKPAL
jgi:hypothetical protein